MNFKQQKTILMFVSAIFLTLGISISFQSLLAAWTAPLANPAACLTGNPGCDAPISSGSPLMQQMQGALWIVDSAYPTNPYGLIVEKGNVGIGTMGPAGKLTVKMRGNGWNDGIVIEKSDSTDKYQFSFDAPGRLLLGYNEGTVMSWNNGNVGIGMAGPGQKLQVEGNIQGHRIKFSGVGGDSGVGADYYAIYQESGAWAHPFPDLRIQYHTGIKYDAYQGYGGHRFYTGYDGTGNPIGLKMQISDKVYVTGDLNVSGTAFANGQALCQANGINCPVASTNADTVDSLHADSFRQFNKLQNNHYSGSDGGEHAAVFYDADNSGYYVDPHNVSRQNRINFTSLYGVQFGSAAPRWDFSSYVVESQHLYGHDSTQTMYLGESNPVMVRGDIRSPIFYDYNDTNYYLDPAGTSNINTISGSARARLGLPDNWTNRPSITGDTNYWTGAQGWVANNLNSEVPDWGSTFFDVWGNPPGQPSGASHWQGIQAFHYWNGSTGHGSQLLFGSPMMNGAMFVRSIWGGGWSNWSRIYNDNYRPYADNAGALNGIALNGPYPYYHFGSWGVARTAPGAVLVNTAYRSDYADNAGALNGIALNGPYPYYHFGSWGVARTAPGAVLVNTAYRSDYADNAGALGGYGVGSFCRQDGSNCPASTGLKLDTWQSNHYSGSDGGERAVVFYDADDPAYYVDPHNVSRQNRINFTSLHGVSRSIEAPRWDFSTYVVESQYLYGHNPTQTMYLGESNPVIVRGDIRSPIFYDQDNTNYYVDPNGTSKLNAMQTTGRYYSNEWIQMDNHSGLYSPLNNAYFYPNNASYGSWRINGSRNTWGGLEFDSAGGNLSLMMNNGNGWGAQYTGVHNNSYGWLWYFVHGNLYADMMYDKQDANYYMNPNGTSRMKEIQADRVYGFDDIRSPIFYDYDNTNYYVNPAETSKFATLYADIMYDRSGNSYYVDPSGTSVFYNVKINGTLSGGASYSKCIGVCKYNEIATCPSGYDLIYQDSGKGCQAVVHDINPKVGGRWVVRTDNVVESLWLDGVSICESSCKSAWYQSSQAVCCQ